ncbi:MAG: two-component system, sensor histidine kinase and response regulator, partial [Pseudonocardiales bacterium]|nr:two-component system, sensor histidine kinase and response regulator [Pseudonocardiales bacterium]
MSPNNETISPLRLLLLEDNPADADLVIAELRRAGLFLEVKVVGTKAAYAECLDSSFDAIVSDYDLPQFNAREALLLLQAKKADIPFIVVSGTMGEETAVDLIKLGAADYLLKDRLARLPQALAHAVQDRALRVERANVQEALRESEERMRAILESALDAVVTMNHAGEIVELNQASEKIFGLSRCDALGKRLVDLIIPERLRDDHERGLELYLKTGEARMLGRRVEVIAQRIDGTEFPAEMAVMRIGSAEPPLFTAFIRDIGEKLRAQKIVRESEERLQRVIANLREGLIISDMQGELLDWNPAALEMHGITSADQCRFRLADCANTFELSTLDGTILPLEEWPLPRIVRGERLRDFEVRLRRLGTDWERVLSYGGAIVDDPTWGQLAFVTIKDITEQRQTENARREADHHLTDIINSVEGIVWETDEETNRMTFISEKAEEILGYPTARWLAEPGFWRSHMHPDDQEKTISVSTGGNGHSQPTELEYRMVSAAGREVWFKDRVSVVKLPGRSVKQRGIMLDITHRKLADREARAGEARIREQAKLLDLAHDAIMVRDMEDRIEFWNHGAEKLYGWTAAEVHAKEAAPFLRKTDPAGAAAAWAAVIENGKWTGECKHVCKDGG